MIRRATILDISALAIMLNTMHKETELKVPQLKSDKLINKINELIHNGLVFVSIKDNKIQGSIAGQICQDWWSDEKYVGDVWFYVFKEQRKSDVAKKLLQTYIKTAKDAKMKIRLGHLFSGDMDRKDKFFKRLGLAKAGSIFVEA